MKIIATLADKIDDELNDAEEYAELAHETKLEHQKLSETFITLAEQEMTHSKMLHTEAVRLIEETRQRNDDPPAGMLAVYEYVHNKQVKRAAAIRQMIADYRNG